MKTRLFLGKILFVVIIGFSVLFTQKVYSGEFVILNQTFTYGANDNAFSLATVDFSGMPTNWISPDDYNNGTIYAYYEVINVPTSVPFSIQVGVSQYKPSKAAWDGQNFYKSFSYERAQLSGVGSIATFTSSPSSWWKFDGGVDFSKVIDFQSAGPIIWGTSPVGVLSPAPGGSDDTYAVRANWFPLTIKVIIVAVSSGSNFSGWDGYLGACTPFKQSTPTYGIDFYNEKTNKNVPPTDEYSYSSDMSGAVSGTGSKLTLVPGQTVYFRSKADGTCLLTSDIQTLVVPPRPSTPSYTIDYTGEKTMQSVPSLVKYTPDYVNFFSGTGMPITLTPGEDLYFWVNATSSSFYSNVLNLVIPARPAAPSSISTDFINEKTNQSIPSGMEYSTSDSFIASTSGTGVQIAVTPGTDLYFRYKATASNFASPAFLLDVPIRPVAPVATIDYVQEKTVESFPSSVEYSASASMTGASSGSDTTIDLIPGTDLYLRQKSTASSFASGITHLSVQNRPSAPSITIDFANEVTSVIPSTMAWSTDPSGTSPVSGTNTTVAVLPGTDLYIWLMATTGSFASVKQTLDVPVRPAAPSNVNIDFVNERTNQNITTGMEYSASASFSESASGTGIPVAVNPGQSLYIRIKATTNAFVSPAFLLNVPARPATPSFTIDFVNEKTSESVSSGIEYSASEDFASPLSGTGSPASLEPDNNLYFRIKSTSFSFCSQSFLLEIPQRPSLEYTGEDTITAALFSVHAILDESMTGFGLSDISVTNGMAQNLHGENIFDVVPASKGNVEVYIRANSFDNGGFASNQVVVYYKQGTGFADSDLDELMVYPVPSNNGLVTIVINRPGETRIDLLSPTGILIRAFIINDGAIETLNLEDLKGMYYLKISTGDTREMRKIILY